MSDTTATYAGRRRWYDQKPELSRCVSMLETFPAEIRHIIADGLVFLAEREFEAHLMMSSLKSLGPEKVLGIYKSKNKRRSFDQDPGFHKAMNYFFILSPENRLFMAKLTTELMNCIVQYFETCQLYRQPADTAEVVRVTETYVREGGEEARRFLDYLQKQFQHRLTSGPAIPGEPLSKPTLREDSSGMQVRESP